MSHRRHKALPRDPFYWHLRARPLLAICLLAAVGQPHTLWAAPASAQVAPTTDRAAATTPPPWPKRHRKVYPLRPRRQALVDIGQWPQEPSPPEDLDIERLGKALFKLCGPRKRQLAKAYAKWIVEASRRYPVDPFMLGALIYDQTACTWRHRNAYGVGVAAINRKMHKAFVSAQGYRYWVFDAEQHQWTPRELDLGGLRLSNRELRNPRTNILTTAALLHVANEQCPAIDRPFHSVAHRSPVSHIVWGDQVRNAAYEDNILRARRRLLDYYDEKLPPQCGRHKGVAIHSPLDGTPLKVLSGWGEPRRRRGGRHRGIDIFSPRGAPVYAVADGIVTFAGAVMRRGRRAGRSRSMPPRKGRRFARHKLGPGGLFVMVRHGEKLSSAYMHLSRYVVKRGDTVTTGQVIAFSGRSGIAVSRPHLHFELRRGRRLIDPQPYLADCTIPPGATIVGRRRRRGRRYRRHRAKAQIHVSVEPVEGPPPPISIQ